MDLSKLSLEELVALATEKREELAALFAIETPTDEQVSEAEALGADIDAITEASNEIEAAATERADKFAALKDKFAEGDMTPEEKKKAEEDAKKAEEDAKKAEEDAAAAADAEEADDDAVEEAATKVAARSTVKTLASKTPRPKAPQAAKSGGISITASADVPEFAAGKKLDSLEDVAKALINRSKGFPKFSPSSGGDGKAQLHKFGVASLQLEFPDDLTIKRGSDDLTVIEHARKESRLDGKSLTAAGGWCAPSENIYDLCDGETLDGIVSVPEINVTRGGINYTSGPDFATLYTDTGFIQTEAQAIAGTEKDCYEVACPAFTNVRLDAIGLCLTFPILTNAAYPELIQRVVSGSIIAHQHRVNASVIARMVTLSGAARVVTGLGSTVSDSLEALELLADERRQHYRLGISSTLEVIVPFWVKGAFRSDIARRNGIDKQVVTDADIQAHFAARNLNVQWAYDWQPINEGFEAYPASYQALLYPAGTFVKGVNDVINLSAVYDAASLQVNTYTGIFMEMGLLVAKTCYGSDLVTLPISSTGEQGALSFATPIVGS